MMRSRLRVVHAVALGLFVALGPARGADFWLQEEADISQYGTITNPTLTLAENQTRSLYIWYNTAGTNLGFDGISLDVRLISLDGGSAETQITLDDPPGRWTGTTAGGPRVDSGGIGIDDCNAFDLTNTDTLTAGDWRFARLDLTGVQTGTVLVFLCVGDFRIIDEGAGVPLRFGFASGSTSPENFTIFGSNGGFCSNVPEATLHITPHQPGDMDFDGDVDMDDFALLQWCLSGDFIPQPNPACAPAKLDGDDDVDANDLILFLGCLSGPNIPADPDCAD